MLISWGVTMGDIAVYNLATLCLNGTLPGIDFMDVSYHGRYSTRMPLLIDSQALFQPITTRLSFSQSEPVSLSLSQSELNSGG